MPKFATPQHKPLVRNVIQTAGPGITFEGGPGAIRDTKSELFLLAISNLVGEDTFYEKGKARDDRYRSLVHLVTADDPGFVAALVPYLRDQLNLRSVAVVTACEYVAAAGPFGRPVISAACRRADEPAEVIAYWQATYGRKLPKPVKRGVADAAARLYNESATLRYDGHDRVIRFGDVLEMTHPTPTAPWQGALFEHLLDRTHGYGDKDPIAEQLTMLRADAQLRALPTERRRTVVQASAAGANAVRFADDEIPTLQAAGWSWERLAGWLPGGMDAEAWQAIIPTMGYMALLRNLRNFDKVGVPDSAIAPILTRLADPAEVARSRQLPFRFYSAYREVGSLRWAYALEQALEASLSNVPALKGSTLVMVDVSASMNDRLSTRSERLRWEVASIFGTALAKRAQRADLMLFSDRTMIVNYDAPLLRIVDGTRNYVGGGTYTAAALAHHFQAHDRVVILTDEQAAYTDSQLDQIMTNSPATTFFTFNLAGYGRAHAPSLKNHFTFGGLSDAGFTLIETIEAGRDGSWPHLVNA